MERGGLGGMEVMREEIMSVPKYAKHTLYSTAVVFKGGHFGPSGDL